MESYDPASTPDSGMPPPPPAPDPQPAYEAAGGPPPPPPPSGGQYQSIPPPPVGGAGTMSVQNERLYATFIHLSPLIIVIVGMGLHLPMFGFLGPLVMWLLKKNESAFIDDQGKEALNFSITISIAMLISFVLIFVFIGFLLIKIIGIFALVMAIIAALKANQGIYYRYPINIRLIR